VVPPIVGRDSELAVVDAFLDDRRPGTLAIVGEAGIGKTAVFGETVSRARARGALVLVARPSESEAKLSFAGLTDLVSDVGEDAFAALPAPQRTALDAVLLRAATARPPERRLVGTALLSLVRNLAATQQVVVAIDDLPWLDTPSHGTVEFAMRRLTDEPVVAVVSRRSEAGRAGSLEVGGERRPELVELGPLSLAALYRILVDALGRTFSRPTLVRLVQASGGNPLYALEIARLLPRDADGGETGALPVPEDLRTLVARRVRALPESTRAALLRAAALARPDLDLVDAEALAAAEEAGLVRVRADRRIAFAHPLYAAAVYSSASLSRRQETHRLLAGTVTDPEEQARHLALGCEARDDGVARTVEAAARHARARGAPDAAAELTELALRLTPETSPDADERRLALAEYRLVAGDYERAAQLLERLRDDVVHGDLRARVLLALAEIDYWRRGDPVGVALAEEALLAARDPLIRARCHAELAGYAGTVDPAKAAVEARAALALLERLPEPDPELVAQALGARVRADLFLGEGFDAEAAERALRLEEAAPPMLVDTRIVFKLGQWLRYVDDLDGARERLAQAEQAANDEGDEPSLANILLNQVGLETWAGNWGEATNRAERMLDAYVQLGVAPERVAPWRAYPDAHAGRLDAVRAAAEEAAAGQPITGVLWNRNLGLAELAAGETESADRHLSEALAELDQAGFREPAVNRVVGDVIQAAVAVGDLDRAEALTSRFEERAARSRIPWSLAVSSRCRGLVLAERGDLTGAAAALSRAVAEHERCPVPFARARTLLVQGRVLRRAKRKRDARASLEEARSIFRSLGAEPWAERASAELERVAVRRAPHDLSATELRIAQLAASGLTNQAIAAQVFLTRKAVEANLGRAYRKLGIRSRAQLARALDARESSSRAASEP